MLSTARRLMVSPRPRPVRSLARWAKGRKSSSALPGGRPPLRVVLDLHLAFPRADRELDAAALRRQVRGQRHVLDQPHQVEPRDARRAGLEAHFRDRSIDDGAAVERVEFIDGDVGAALRRELGDRLADVAIVMHHLADGEALLEKIAAVVDRAGPHRRRRRLQRLQSQRLRELIEKERDPVLQLIVGRQRHAPLQDLGARQGDQRFTMLGEKVSQHGSS
jgi:hypothetical protein